jgi:hypothetical protein
MVTLAISADERVEAVSVSRGALCVALRDGRTISAPLAWYPRLLKATASQRKNWKPCGAGYGIYWPELDEHLSTEGLLRGAPSPEFRRELRKPVRKYSFA